MIKVVTLTGYKHLIACLDRDRVLRGRAQSIHQIIAQRQTRCIHHNPVRACIKYLDSEGVDLAC